MLQLVSASSLATWWSRPRNGRFVMVTQTAMCGCEQLGWGEGKEWGEEEGDRPPTPPQQKAPSLKNGSRNPPLSDSDRGRFCFHFRCIVSVYPAVSLQALAMWRRSHRWGDACGSRSTNTNMLFSACSFRQTVAMTAWETLSRWRELALSATADGWMES